MNIIEGRDVKLFNCDNLICLNSLDDESVDLVVIDVLYATGRTFSDFVDLKPIRAEVEKHYIPRFQDLYRVMKDNATLYVMCDFHANHWIRILLDDIFGYSNFRNEIIWTYNSAPRRKNCFGNRHDTIFRYSKSNQFTFNESEVREAYSPTAPKEYAKARYYHKDGKILGDVWLLNILAQNDKTERLGFSAQKPKSLLERIIKVSSNINDTVLDIYAGSHTTGEVALENNRKYIGCDISERSLEIGKKRLGKWLN